MSATITINMFASDPNWNYPGLDWKLNSNRQQRYSWSNYIPLSSRATLTPAFPSWTKSPPSSTNWRTEVPTAEWATVSTNWSAVARTLLRDDPYFAFFLNDKTVDSSGKWSEAFRNNPAYKLVCQQLALRMREEIEVARRLLVALEQPLPQLSANSREDTDTEYPLQMLEAPPREDGGGTEEDQSDLTTLWSIPWRSIGQWTWRGVNAGRMWCPQGAALNLALNFALPWAYRETRDWFKSQREVQRQKSHRGFAAFSFDDLSASAEEFVNFANAPSFRIQGFESQTWRLPLWAARSPQASDFNWTSASNAPQYLTSQDGYFN